MAALLEWWGSLALARQICLLVAIPSSVVLIIQTILLLIGLDDDDLDAEAVADDGFALFSIRGIVSMLCIMGWSGFGLLDTAMPDWAAILISVALGIATLIAMAYLMRFLQKMQSSGNIEMSNTIGKVGQVYIPIPANAAAAGKVNITVQEKYSEFSAITLEKEDLSTGTYVRVVAIDDAGTLVVERLSTSD